jgi:hypothetical protein
LTVDSESLLAAVAITNAIGANLALLIHALRVPYRESQAQESRKSTELQMRARAADQAVGAYPTKLTGISP